MKRFANTDGLLYTAGSEDSVAQFERVVDCFMAYDTETGKALKTLSTDDPEMPMALCTRGYFAKMMGSARQSARAVSVLEQVKSVAEGNGVTPREAGHIAALEAWCEGRLDDAADQWEQILLDHPLDGLALRLAHFNHFHSGFGHRMRDSMARVLPFWPDDHRWYAYLLGMYAFGLEECGDYARSEMLGRRAVEANPADVWSVHAVAHVMEMMERHDEGIAWIRELEPHWSATNNFRNHVHWHRCLFHLEKGEHDEILDLYDRHVGAYVEEEFNLDMCNATALLLRLEMHDVDVGDRWAGRAEVARGHIDDRERVFNSLHYHLALLGAGEREQARELESVLEDWAREESDQGRIARQPGLAVARAQTLHRAEDFDGVIAALEPVRYQFNRLGGSHAQCDVWTMLWLDAVRRAPRRRAVGWFAERVAVKPASSWGWKGYRAVVDTLGLEAEVRQHRHSSPA